MIRILRQTFRGAFYLPYVGPHPGLLWLVLFLVVGMVAGGWRGLLIMAALMIPLFCVGAYDRAELADKIADKERRRAVAKDLYGRSE